MNNLPVYVLRKFELIGDKWCLVGLDEIVHLTSGINFPVQDLLPKYLE